MPLISFIAAPSVLDFKESKTIVTRGGWGSSKKTQRTLFERFATNTSDFSLEAHKYL
jgi:hypothetical protein